MEALVEARDRGVGRATGAYLFALLLLVAVAGLARPELALLKSGSHLSLAAGGLAVTALLAWLFPVARGAAATITIPRPAAGEPGSVTAPPLSDTAQASLAVLPLDSLSGAADDALIAQGFSAEIVRALSGVPDLRVVPFLQSAAHAGRKLGDVARELNVRYVLSGSLQRAAGRLRVIAMLTDASTGQQAWSESYERAVDDLFQVQRELAEAIAIETGSRYLNIVSNDLCRQPPQGLSAWSLTHKALTFWTVSYTREASADAIQWLDQALALEPDNAMAHVVLGFVLNQRVINSFAEDPPEENRRALAEVEAALRLAPRDATVMEYASLVWLNCGMRKKSLQTARRVVGIAPFNMIAWGYVGCGLTWGGTEEERAEGIAILQRLLKVAPNHPSVPFWHYFLSFGHTEAGDYRTAREHAQFAVNIHPGFTLGWAQLANALGALGEADAARHAIEQAQKANPRFRPDGLCRYMVAIAHEVGMGSVRRQTDGLVRAGLLAPLVEASAA
jgi:TolB-like protein/cytochrome c-type biogenesis protein CcmH/NrfG